MREGPGLWQVPTLRGEGEDRFLATLFPDLPTGPDVVVGPGDDAAVLRVRGDLVVTTDTMVLGRDWLDEWAGPADVGTKCVVINLSDIEAMGADPVGVVVTLAADPEISRGWALELSRAIGAACGRWDVPVLGGDLSSAGAGVVVVGITALGRVARPVLRSGAAPGDVLAVRGSLGYAAAGLRILMGGRGAGPDEARDTSGTGPDEVTEPGLGAQTAARAVARQRRPELQRGAGVVAARAGASAMLDLSDGLVRDAGRLARASAVRIDLDPDALALDVEALAVAVGREAALECVLAGGEEHSLLATFPAEPPTGWRAIGRVTPGPGRVTLGGQDVSVAGWDHFEDRAEGAHSS